jgi:hypothetical protein
LIFHFLSKDIRNAGENRHPSLASPAAINLDTGFRRYDELRFALQSTNLRLSGSSGRKRFGSNLP